MDLVLIYLQILTAKNKIHTWKSETRIHTSSLQGYFFILSCVNNAQNNRFNSIGVNIHKERFCAFIVHLERICPQGNVNLFCFETNQENS